MSQGRKASGAETIQREGTRRAVSRTDAARKRAAVELIARHEASLKRTARRFSLDSEDAEDAYQRALEIVLTKAPTTDLRELIRWTQTVVRHEALAVRQGRERLLGRPPAAEGAPDPVALLPAIADGPDEQAERREEVARGREALRALKPAELRALTLLAEGYSYAEIGAMTGFSKTKVNRLLTEGRARFRSVLSGSEDGSRCRQLQPLLSAFCDGEAGAADAETVREHLRACASCRSTLRAYRAAPRVVAGLAPLLPAGTLAAGAPARPLAQPASRLPGFGGGEVAGTQARGGGWLRGAGLAGLAKLLAVCAAAAGGATACVATGVLPAPAALDADQLARRRSSESRRRSSNRRRGGRGRVTAPAAGRRPRRQPTEPVKPQPTSPEPAPAPAEPVEYEAPPPTARSTGPDSGESAAAGSEGLGGRGVRAVSAPAQRPAASSRSPFASERSSAPQRVGPGIALLRLPLAISLGGPPVSPRRRAAATRPERRRRRGNWHPERVFSLGWTNPPGVASAHYRLLDPGGDVALGEQTLALAAEPNPLARSARRARRLHGRGLARGRRRRDRRTRGSQAALRRRIPGPVEPAPAAGWIGRTAFPYAVHLSHPDGDAPLSGIRGYAISVDRDSAASPARATICDDGEIDLRGGVGDDRLRSASCPRAPGTCTLWPSPARDALGERRNDRPARRQDRAGNPSRRRPGRLVAQPGDADRDGLRRRLGNGAGRRRAGPVHRDRRRRRPAGARPRRHGQLHADRLGRACRRLLRPRRGRQRRRRRPTNGLPNREPATAVVRIDREPPRIAFAGAQDPHDPERIEARAADGLSGLDPSRGSIGVRPAGSGTRFTELATELRGGTLRARWDSESWPPGEYEFRATAYDAAGNAASTELRTSGAPMRLTAPVKPAPRVLAQLRGRAAQSGRGAWLGGRLVAGRQTALAGLPVRVLERFAAGALPRQRVSVATTDAGGRFGVRLGAGPSREVLVHSPSTPTLRAATSRPLRIAVTARVRLRVSSARARVGGRPIVFSGRVGDTGGHIPADGKLVNLQFRLPGLPWREFRSVRTDRHGHFRYAYRFADDDSRGAHFQFRAVAPAQAGWPYEPAGSLPVTVTGI